MLTEQGSGGFGDGLEFYDVDCTEPLTLPTELPAGRSFRVGCPPQGKSAVLTVIKVVGLTAVPVLEGDPLPALTALGRRKGSDPEPEPPRSCQHNRAQEERARIKERPFARYIMRLLLLRQQVETAVHAFGLRSRLTAY